MQTTRLLLNGLPPRIRPTSLAVQHREFLQKHAALPNDTRAEDAQKCVIRGRVASIRSASSKLHFVDVVSGEDKIQAVALPTISSSKDPAAQDDAARGTSWPILRDAVKSLSKGDHVEVLGVPGRTATGELSIFAESVTRLSRCGHRIPERYSDVEKRLRNRHLDFLVNAPSRETMRVRSRVVSGLRRFLEAEDFMEVETPMLSSSASGATARPFVTESAILNRSLQLRIAPELALKRAVLGGFERVFEVGKCFRNEGLSRRHNPEFTTCEFYAAYWGLEDLVTFTERLLVHLEDIARSPDDDRDGKPRVFESFQRLDFLPTLETRLGQRLPHDGDLEGMSALLQSLGHPAPSLSQVEHLDHGPASTTEQSGAIAELPLPQDAATRSVLMAQCWDTLATVYLEPLAKRRPTFILSPPSVLAPLAKSTEARPLSSPPSSTAKASTTDAFAAGGSTDRDWYAGIGISHRFELYAGGMELINAYEEENDAGEQRRKFLLQRHNQPADPAAADATAGEGGRGSGTGGIRGGLTPEEESYCRALEYGLPPTAGWGMGIDRLIMLLTGAKTINEVLLAGGLRYQAGSS